MAMVLIVGLVAHGLIAFGCYLVCVVLMGVCRLFKWPDLQVTLSAFATLFFLGGIHHTMVIIESQYQEVQWVTALATCLVAGMIIVASMFLFNLVQGRRLMFSDMLSRLRGE